MRDLPTHSPRSFPWLELALKPCHKIMHALRMTSGKRLRLPNVSARGTKPAPTAAAQGGFLLSLGRMQPNLSKVRHRVGTQLGCGGFGALVPTIVSLEAEPRDELSSVESWDRFGLAWQEGLPGTVVLQSTCCAPEAGQGLTLAQPDFSKERLCSMEEAPKHTFQGIRTNPTGTNSTGERTERLARIRTTTSLASHFP